MKRSRAFALWLAAVLALAGCTFSDADATLNGTASASVDTSEMFTDQDLEIGYDEENSDYIALSDEGITTTSPTVAINGSTVTIQAEGVYILSGSLSNGMIIVDAPDTDKIQLVLQDVHITSATSAAIYVREADKVFITTASGTQNTLSNGGVYTAIDENQIDAVIFSKSDLTLNGAGTLILQANAGHGVVSKDDLVCASGSYEISAANHGLSGKDSVRIASGDYVISSGKDGIHAENADDANLGFAYIQGGTFNITAAGDGVNAAAYLLIEDGNFTILSGGGSANAAQTSTESSSRPGAFRNEAQTASQEDTASTKGIKATTNLIIQQGSFSIDSADDALHSNGNVTLYGGTYVLSTGDDGIHADSAVLIADGNITITQSYEGIEGLTVDITGGVISIVSSDDGLNAAGGNDSSGLGRMGRDSFSATEGAYIQIAGGTITIDASSGDGIDSNGDLLVSGGTIYVSGPTDSGNSALDYDGTGTITGGTIIAVGPSGMSQSFGTSFTQGVMMVSTGTAPAGSVVTLTDSTGNTLLSWQSPKAFSSVVISCPEIVQGETYTLDINGSSMQVVMDSLVYGSGSMGGGRGGNQGGGGKGRP